MTHLKLSLILAAVVTIVAPTAAFARPTVAAHPHNVTVRDHTPQVHFRNVVEHHGR
jgi:hypothetical protein